jgi:hypothetical protein
MNSDDRNIPSFMSSWTGEAARSGPFRTPQSFTLISAQHLLSKLKWDMEQLALLQWDESLYTHWRQVVSYKAIDCATSIWHLHDWFCRDIRGAQQRERACAFLNIEGHDCSLQIPLNVMQKKTVAKCPDLEICRVIAIASKHYSADHKARPDIETFAAHALAKRGEEPFMRPFMHLAVIEKNNSRNMIEVLANCQQFWTQFGVAVTNIS